jgi:hypothetical protein
MKNLKPGGVWAFSSIDAASEGAAPDDEADASIDASMREVAPMIACAAASTGAGALSRAEA